VAAVVAFETSTVLLLLFGVEEYSEVIFHPLVCSNIA
jgi:hypothetical protein